MVRILLPFLMLFSLSVFAQTDFTVGLKSAGVVDIDFDSEAMAVAQTVRLCTTTTEGFDRLYIVTGAATQYKQSETTGMKPSSLKLVIHEVGWQSTEEV